MNTILNRIVFLFLAVTFTDVAIYAHQSRESLNEEFLKQVERDAGVSSLKRLLDEGADINARSARKSSLECNALHFAAHKGSEKLVKFLIDQGVEVDAKGRFLRYRDATPLCLAVLSSNVGAVACLLEAGADARYENVRDETGERKTVLQLTSNVEIERLLVDHGATYGDPFPGLLEFVVKRWSEDRRRKVVVVKEDETGDQSW